MIEEKIARVKELAVRMKQQLLQVMVFIVNE